MQTDNPKAELIALLLKAERDSPKPVQAGINGNQLLRLDDETLREQLLIRVEAHREALLSAIAPLAGLLRRYRTVPGPPIHLSLTAAALYALDEIMNQEFCVKKMKIREQFEAEIRARFTQDGKALSSKAVISVLRWHTPPGVSVTDARGQTEEPQHTAEGDEHPFVLVMARGERSLHDACAKERIAGYDSQVIVEAFRSILLCVQDLHEAGVVHADLKQR